MEIPDAKMSNSSSYATMEADPASLDRQFFEFAKWMDNNRDGKTINLYRSDYWLRQSKVLDDRILTMTDTGLAWWKLSNKSELTYNEWYEVLTDICNTKEINQEQVEVSLTTCGLPGSVQVIVPRYRAFFDTFNPRSKLVY